MASVATTKSALLGALAATFANDPEVQVSHGTPDPSAIPNIVAVLDSTSEREVDEQRFDHVLVVSCYVGGGAAAGPLALARAHALLETAHLAIHADPTLAGGCRVAAMDPGYRSVETIAYDAGGTNPVGRLAEITATVHTWTGRSLLGTLASPQDIP